MIRFFGQPKYSYHHPDHLIGYELLLREWQEDRWCVPNDFDQFGADAIAELLRLTLTALPDDLPLLSFNLDQRQFAAPQFIAELTRLATTLPHPEHLAVELTERDEHIGLPQLTRAAAAYAAAGLRVCLADVGTGANQPAVALALMPYTTEYKFPLRSEQPTSELQSH